MASILYRGEESILVEYDQYEAMLSAGWSTTQDAKPKEPVAEDPVREAAKAAGIEGWDTKRISTLRKALEAQ